MGSLKEEDWWVIFSIPGFQQNLTQILHLNDRKLEEIVNVLSDRMRLQKALIG